LIPGGHAFLVATLNLKGNLEFRLDGTLIISTNRNDYSGDGVIMASSAPNLTIAGRGKIEGRSLAFMTGYDAPNEWWLFQEWRPKLFVLTGCTNLVVRDITFGDAPFWGLHLLGCEHVLVDHLTVNNRLDVPNCDGIDPDHCRRVEIKNCRLTCGDDAIVVKSTRQPVDYGDCAGVRVHDCVIRTQDAGLKIGTETAGNIHDIIFERCRILSSSRGLCLQLRDEGCISNVTFRDIQLVARYHSDPWWGRGEDISFTTLPRTAETKLGRLQNVFVENVSGKAENSIRVNGSAPSRIENIQFKNVSVTLSRWTKYPGGVYDNRPTRVLPSIVAHKTDGFNISRADHIMLDHCRVRWAGKCPDNFGSALSTEDVRDLRLRGTLGDAAHPASTPDVWLH
jgi:hypothetical protein